jgi:hypothetical protein
MVGQKTGPERCDPALNVPARNQIAEFDAGQRSSIELALHLVREDICRLLPVTHATQGASGVRPSA